ncbi:NAD+ synthase [Jatrophihabitans sp.]|uniref:NAD+ synthase n=1 Tax=Jatrophihabitans sp. TaxID=1932789 RepID=UPI0030C69846
MTTLRLALAQVNCRVGDLGGNAAMVLETAHAAATAGADLLAFPELTITGYPPEDLVLRPGFRAASQAALEKLAADLAAAGLGELAVVVGYVDDDGLPRNAAAFVHRGAVLARYFKQHLPNYGVFDERRYFIPGDTFVAVRHKGVDIALTICEDVWQDGGPFAVAGAVGVDLVVNINGSPYERNKDDLRLPLLQGRAAEAGAAIAYVNTVGGQDELVFDGDSMVVARDGAVLLRAPQFVEDVYYLDLEVPERLPVHLAAPATVVERVTTEVAAVALTAPALPAVHADRMPDEAEVWGALVVGLRDYVTKNGFRSVVLGMSGGIDSAVVAALAADAIGGANVHGISLPSAYSSDHSRSDAELLAERIGAHYREVPIAPMVDAFVDSLGLTGLAEENVQARVRGTTLMALSNAEGHLVLATGNKSELAVGYSTIYGDAVGGFAPIKDVPKTLVWQLARWRNADAASRGELPPIPENSISKPPSAELRPGQLDTDSLPDYELLDAVLERYVDRDQGVAEIVAAGFDADTVARLARLVDGAEWKRRQYPPGPKISFKAFGKDRRLPITSAWREGLR